MRVLYIEDEPLARWTGKQVLESLGHDVSAVESCAQAEDLWGRNPFDLVVSDWRLADGMATDMISRMREQGKQEPVICLSGEVEAISEDTISELSISAVLKKPMDAENLEKAILGTGGHHVCKTGKEAVKEEGWQPETEASTGEAPPVWLSPDWSVVFFGVPEWCNMEAARGACGDVWILLYDRFRGGRLASRCAPLTNVLFKQKARMKDHVASAAEFLAEFKDAVGEHISSDLGMNAQVLHLTGDGLSSGGAAGRGWSVFCRAEPGTWKALRPGEISFRERVDGLLVLNESASGLFPDGTVKGGAGEIRQVIERNERSDGFAYLIEKTEPCRSFRLDSRVTESALDGLLWRVESALLSDGCERVSVRRFVCALLGLMEASIGDLEIGWDAQAMYCEVGVDVDLPEAVGLFFDSVEKSEKSIVMKVFRGDSARVQPEDFAVESAGDQPVGSKIGLFDVVSMPTTVVSRVIDEVESRYGSSAWLALDMLATRYISPQALLACFRSSEARIARGRKGAGEGRLCFTGFSALNSEVLESWGVDNHIDLAPDPMGLESLSRRLTSSSERSALLENM